MERQENNQQSSNNNSDDLITFLNSNHHSFNNSVDFNAFLNNNHQNSNNSVDFNSFLNNNLQNSNNNSVDLTSFLNNQQNGSIGNNFNGGVGYQQLARAMYQSSTYQNLDSETLLQNMAIGLNRLSINGGASSNGFDNGLAIGNNFLPESAYPPVLPNQLASVSTIDTNLNNIVIGANPQLSINGGASYSNGNNFLPKSLFPPPASPDLRHRQPSTRSSTGFQRHLIQGLDLVSRSALSVWGCNHLQKTLEKEGNSETKDWIITKVTPDLPILMMHQNGSAFAQTLFKSCDKQQLSKILHSVVLVNESLFITMCSDYYGYEHNNFCLISLFFICVILFLIKSTTFYLFIYFWVDLISQERVGQSTN